MNTATSSASNYSTNITPSSHKMNPHSIFHMNSQRTTPLSTRKKKKKMMWKLLTPLTAKILKKWSFPLSPFRTKTTNQAQTPNLSSAMKRSRAIRKRTNQAKPTWSKKRTSLMQCSRKMSFWTRNRSSDRNRPKQNPQENSTKSVFVPSKSPSLKIPATATASSTFPQAQERPEFPSVRCTTTSANTEPARKSSSSPIPSS